MSLTSAPKRPSHHKKVTGDHHRQSKRYLKIYHPYLPLLVLAIVGMAVNIFWSHHTSVLGASTSMSSQDLLESTNQSRHDANQDPLQMDNKLSAAAQAKANDMANRGYWSHTAPDGQTAWSLIRDNGYSYFKAGENLAYGFSNPSDTVHGWLNSPSHRANLLGADYTDVGFGIATAKNYRGSTTTTIVVAMYGEPSLAAGNFGILGDTNIIEPPLQNVSRVQMLTNGAAPWSVAVVSFISLLAVGWFLMRHAKVWHRVLVQSEAYVVHHKWLDVVIISVAVAGFVLTRAGGFIH